MSESITYYAFSDHALLAQLGGFLKHHRLMQNKTQQQLADAAGIGRVTLVLLEQGKGSHLLSLIQVLRALDLLHLFQHFEAKPIISPLLIAEMTYGKRKRARAKKASAANSSQSDW